MSGTAMAPFDTILLVASARDNEFLSSVLRGSGRRLYTAGSYRQALAVLCQDRVSLIVCEEKLPDGNWKDVLGQAVTVPEPPYLIVTSETATASLWAEVLNLGGYDLLMKPFDPEEVSRVVTSACSQRSRERERAAAAPRVRHAGAGD